MPDRTIADRLPETELAVSDALEVFRDSAIFAGAHRRLLDRLIDVQAMVGDDLAWVEAALCRDTADGLPPATEAAQHLVSRGGKRVRPLLVLLSAACFGRISSAARTLAVVAELVHSATLLHDDVADEGMERRGAATSRRVWGNAVSVLAGDLLLVHALQSTIGDVPEALPELLATLRQLVDGEVLQLRGRTQLYLSESHYERVVRAKTASLFAWAARSGARSAAAPPGDVDAMGRFGERIGVAFQLVDDALDYLGAATGKTSLADLRDGKLTLPLVLAVQRYPELMSDLHRIHAGDLEPVDEVAARVIGCGVCGDVRVRAVSVTDAAIEELRGVTSSPALALLKQVARDLVARLG
jgi:octaprenyl-diphosphate synthase